MMKTAKGEQYLEYNERLTKTRAGHIDTRQFAPTMLATPGDFLSFNWFNIIMKSTVNYINRNHSSSMPPELFHAYI